MGIWLHASLYSLFIVYHTDQTTRRRKRCLNKATCPQCVIFVLLSNLHVPLHFLSILLLRHTMRKHPASSSRNCCCRHIVQPQGTGAVSDSPGSTAYVSARAHVAWAASGRSMLMLALLWWVLCACDNVCMCMYVHVFIYASCYICACLMDPFVCVHVHACATVEGNVYHWIIEP